MLQEHWTGHWRQEALPGGCVTEKKMQPGGALGLHFYHRLMWFGEAVLSPHLGRRGRFSVGTADSVECATSQLLTLTCHVNKFTDFLVGLFPF